MREFVSQDGKRFHLPDTKQREPDPALYQCDCHRRLGNDFWFLPTGSCIRRDSLCDKPKG